MSKESPVKRTFKICIVTQSHLCRNPRVTKEAISLAEAGHEVVILNTVISKNLKQEDLALIDKYAGIQIHPVADLTRPGFYAFLDRAAFKLGIFLVSWLKVQSFLALGYGAMRYFAKCKSIKADLYICHQELATFTGGLLLNAGFKVAFDIEDWYSEDLLPEARSRRPIGLLRRVEALALLRGVFCTTTSSSMAKKLAERYNCRSPAVVYNVFPDVSKQLRKTIAPATPLKLFWFSQTIGPGRGIEEFIGLSQMLSTPHELHLLGNVDPSYRDHLRALMPDQHHIFFHPLVREWELVARIRDFDIGLALERVLPLSRNFTITNKFFQYLEAGLPVIATATAGQQEVFEKFKVGIMLPQAPAPADLRTLDSWLGDPSALLEAQFMALKASRYYSWEVQERTILNLIEKAIE